MRVTAVDQARRAAATSRARSWVSQVKPSPMVLPIDEVVEAAEGFAFAGRPGALDELDDGAGTVAAEHAEEEAEGGGGLAFAGPGVDHEETFFDGLAGDFGVLDGFALRHFSRCGGRSSLGSDIISP